MIKHFLSVPGYHPHPIPPRSVWFFRDMKQVIVFLQGCHSRNLNTKFGLRTQN